MRMGIMFTLAFDLTLGLFMGQTSATRGVMHKDLRRVRLLLSYARMLHD